MENSDRASNVPLFALQPVADGQHAWVAMLLDTPEPLDKTQLAHLLGELGLGDALDNLPCVVRTRSPAACTELVSAPLPAHLVALRFPVAACDDTEAHAHLQRLLQSGFTILADGLPATAASCPDLTGFALDCSSIATADWPALNAFLSQHPGRHLALGVDTPALLTQCQQAGFAWYAGRYALQPVPGKSPRNATRQALLLQLLNLITHDGDSHAIEKLVKQDAQLSYQLLRLVNSVAFSLNHSVASFSQAITLLGRRQLQRWLQLLLYANTAGGGRSPLLPRAALRAALMEALCVDPAGEIREQAFMVGMFSMLDVMLGAPMIDTLSPLKLSGAVSSALLKRAGTLGQLLRIIETAERGDSISLQAALTEAKLDSTAWAGALLRASHWAIRVSREA